MKKVSLKLTNLQLCDEAIFTPFQFEFQSMSNTQVSNFRIVFYICFLQIIISNLYNVFNLHKTGCLDKRCFFRLKQFLQNSYNWRFCDKTLGWKIEIIYQVLFVVKHVFEQKTLSSLFRSLCVEIRPFVNGS